MSTAFFPNEQSTHLGVQDQATDRFDSSQVTGLQFLEKVLDDVQEKIAPVLPLQDYVAINPYTGFTSSSFLAARSSLRSVSDLEMLMDASYYRDRFSEGRFGRADIDAALDELVADGIVGAERLDVNQVISFLRVETDNQNPANGAAASEANLAKQTGRQITTYAEKIDLQTGSDWSGVVREEISRHLAAHFDQGQSLWSSPWSGLPLYQAWRSAAQHDKRLEILGVSGFRKLVSDSPHHPYAMLVALLHHLNVPTEIWSDFLLCQALSTPGWSAWVKHHQQKAKDNGDEDSDFAGLLAIKLAYETALSNHFNFQINWSSIASDQLDKLQTESQFSNEELIRYTLLKAEEIAFRNGLVTKIKDSQESGPQSGSQERCSAQMVFCIDVRSERLRRQLESESETIETFGFAGFFGLPIEFVRLGESSGKAQVPVLLSPRFQVHEEVIGANNSENASATKRRSNFGLLRKAWKEFQSSAISSFGFIEAMGLWYGPKMVARSLWHSIQPLTQNADHIGIARPELTPTLSSPSGKCIDASEQADLAESMLRGIGIVEDFARLVVLCGHESKTENNPLQSGLDCGACGGHSGEVNARVAAKLLNQPSVRDALAERGIHVPSDTHFLAGVHNTTTDQVELLDTHLVPSSHQEDLRELHGVVQSAGESVRAERLAVLPGASTSDLIRRSQDWSELRPEWGLAGNAAFIAAPRHMTNSDTLEGRAFLHSYDYRSDPEFSVLEQIMTAPMIVAHLINMQYYASTVDPIHLGSGTKTVHNVVGQFGLFSGNGGDLMTGLPWQSLHDGQQYQHHPLRLLVVLAAPRDAIENIIGRQKQVEDLLTNGWLHLVAVEDGIHYRYSEKKTWSQLVSGADRCVL